MCPYFLSPHGSLIKCNQCVMLAHVAAIPVLLQPLYTLTGACQKGFVSPCDELLTPASETFPFSKAFVQASWVRVSLQSLAGCLALALKATVWVLENLSQQLLHRCPASCVSFVGSFVRQSARLPNSESLPYLGIPIISDRNVFFRW